MTKVSPQNDEYAAEVIRKAFGMPKTVTGQQQKKQDIRETADSLLTLDQQKEKLAVLYLDSVNRKIIPVVKKDTLSAIASTVSDNGKMITIPQPSIHTPPFQRKDDTTNAVRKEMIQFVASTPTVKKKESKYASVSLPGKAIAYQQTKDYLLAHPKYLLTGTGMGNFSSKVAFKATALKFTGGFPKQFAYIAPDFSVNHLALYLYFFTEHSKKHSITNSPNSVYDQLLSEYGLLGLGAFIGCYIWFFWKEHKRLTYAKPILFLLLGLFFVDYWFEQLSIVIIFELLYFLNLKENTETA